MTLLAVQIGSARTDFGIVRVKTGNQKKTVASGGRHGQALHFRQAGHRHILTQRHACAVRRWQLDSFERDLRQHVHVRKYSVQLGNHGCDAPLVETQARQQSNVSDIGFGDGHLLPPLFEFGLHHDQRLSTNRFIIEVDAHFRVPSAARQFCNGSRSELRVAHTLAGDEPRHIL